MQNGYIERFNRIYRECILDEYLFFELDQVRQLTEEWMDEYNNRRPHESLNNLTPNEWKMKQFKTKLLTNKLELKWGTYNYHCLWQSEMNENTILLI
jgi:hypothetical protein